MLGLKHDLAGVLCHIVAVPCAIHQVAVAQSLGHIVDIAIGTKFSTQAGAIAVAYGGAPMAVEIIESQSLGLARGIDKPTPVLAQLRVKARLVDARHTLVARDHGNLPVCHKGRAYGQNKKQSFHYQ
jgi:hypothetical protein